MFTPNAAAQSVHLNYQLKPSRLLLVFQLSCLLIILFVWYQTLINMLFVIMSMLSCASYLLFLKQDRIVALVQLDETDWTIQYARSKCTYRVQIKKIINHQLYIVVFFQTKKIKSMLIFSDELHKKSWKSLTIRSKLA